MVTSTVYAHVLTEQADQAADTFARVAFRAAREFPQCPPYLGGEGSDAHGCVSTVKSMELLSVKDLAACWSVSAKRDLRSGLWLNPRSRFASTHSRRNMGCQHPVLGLDDTKCGTPGVLLCDYRGQEGT